MEEKTISPFNIEELKQVLFKINSLDKSFLKQAYHNESAFEDTIKGISIQLGNVLKELDKH